jgi:CheY-like chemotaxis protein
LTCPDKDAFVKISAEPVVILMADDDEDDQFLTAEAVRVCKLANELHIVSSGVELMDYLYHRGKFAPPARSPRPGLVLLDLNMPKKDGREALREIKADPSLRSIPVVILTTSSAHADIEGIYDLGGNSFITKPVTFDALAEAIRVTTEYWFQIVRLPSPLSFD